MKAAKSQGEQLVNDWKYLCPRDCARPFHSVCFRVQARPFKDGQEGNSSSFCNVVKTDFSREF